MHGVQPRAKTTPSSGAAATPTAGSRWMRSSRRPSGSTPANISPSATISTPSTRVIASAWLSTSTPALPITAPVTTNTAAIPRTNSDVPASIRPRRRVPSTTSAAPSPVAYER